MKTTLLPIVTLLAASTTVSAATTFGLNFSTSTSGTTISGEKYAVAQSDWYNFQMSNSTMYNSSTRPLGSQTFTTTAGLSGWVSMGEWWNCAAGSTGDVFRSTLDARNTAGLAGKSSVIQLTGVTDWLVANNASSLTVTVFYATYNDANKGYMNQAHASAYSGELTSANASTFISGATLLGTSSFASTTNPYAIGSEITGITGDFMLTSPNVGNSYQGGIAAVKFEAVPVPEPSTYALLGAAAAVGLAVVRRRKAQR